MARVMGVALCVAVLAVIGSVAGAQAIESSTAAETAASAPGAPAQDDVAARLAAVEETVARQQELIEQQARQLGDLTSQGAVAALESKGRDEKPAAPQTPPWLAGLRFYGDLLLRYEAINYSGDTKDINRGRFRLRFGVEKQVADELLLGFRLASGSNNDPTSANQTFTDDFSKKDVLDRPGLHHIQAGRGRAPHRRSGQGEEPVR